MILLNVDLSQAELRAMALFSQDEWMINALQEGSGDFFDNHLMPVAFPAIVNKYGSIEAYKEADPVAHKEDRTKVKAVQYGLAFGRQAPAIARSLGMPVKQAEQIVFNYLNTATGFAAWRESIMDAAINPENRHLLVNPFGREFQAEVITQRNWAAKQREALSFLPQSTSSDICLMSAMTVNSDAKELGCKIINVVHDAIMFECPNKEVAEAVGELTGQVMRQVGAAVLGDAVPFLSDYSVGKSWGDLD